MNFGRIRLPPTRARSWAAGFGEGSPRFRRLLAGKIIRRRKSAGLTQTDLARRAGIRPETLSRLEKGKSTPGVETADKTIRVLERVEAKASP